LPVPLPPAVMVIQAALLVAVQVHPAAPDTLALADPPAAAAEYDVGDTVNVHDCPCCVRVKVWPAIEIVPVLGEVPVLAETENPTAPLPVPLLPEVTVIQAAPDEAVQLQPAPAVTETLPLPVPAPSVEDVGAMLYVQGESST
jgi:hypothetical protein